MTAYRDLKNQLAELQKQVAVARAEEAADMLAEIRARIAEFGFTPEQIFGRIARKAYGEPARTAPPPKYRNPSTGATWSGRGRAPAWIAGVTNRKKFLIDGP